MEDSKIIDLSSRGIVFLKNDHDFESAFLEEGSDENTLKILEKKLQKKSNNIDALTQRGIILLRNFRVDDAIDCFDKILESEPENSEILFSKGLALEFLGNESQAIIHYEKAMKINSDNVELFRNIGFHIIELGGYSNSKKFFERILKIDPMNEYAVNGKKWSERLEKNN